MNLYLHNGYIVCAVINTILKITRSKRPEALEIPAVSDAITVANGFTLLQASDVILVILLLCQAVKTNGHHNRYKKWIEGHGFPPIP